MIRLVILTLTSSREITESIPGQERKNMSLEERKHREDFGICPEMKKRMILMTASITGLRCKGMFELSTYSLKYQLRDKEYTLTQGRYTAPILFPLLDSYPASIFDVGSGTAVKLAVHAGLTTSTAVADQVRAIGQVARRLVQIEEREALYNGLQVIAEEYDEGWDSGSDSDDDE